MSTRKQYLTDAATLNEQLWLAPPHAPLVFDCRFALPAPEAGRLAYMEAHIPGAVYAHLEDDLSDMSQKNGGRHPLPDAARIAAMFSRLGIGNDRDVVVYDDAGGMVAARLWWMLRYLGHDKVRVLDGGWQGWTAAGLPVEAGDNPPQPAHFSGSPDAARVTSADAIAAGAAALLVDAREAARYRGEVEPIDPVAGHIPGAVNHCWQQNLDERGCFHDDDTLRRQLTQAAGGEPGAGTVYYCGSGVSACHNILAHCLAGWPEPVLFPGSWSEWCRDSGRQVIIGDDPGALAKQVDRDH